MRISLFWPCGSQLALESQITRTCGASAKRGTQESNLALRFWRPQRCAVVATLTTEPLVGGVGRSGTAARKRWLSAPTGRAQCTPHLVDQVGRRDASPVGCSTTNARVNISACSLAGRACR